MIRCFLPLFAVIAFTGLAVLGAYSFAAERPVPGGDDGTHASLCHSYHDGCRHCYDDLLARRDQLGLSEDQVSRIKRLASDSAQKRIDMAADLRKAQVQWTELLDREDVDLAAVRQEIEQTARGWADLRYACVRNVIEIKFVLTAEQWDRWRNYTHNMILFRIGTD